MLINDIIFHLTGRSLYNSSKILEKELEQQKFNNIALNENFIDKDLFSLRDEMSY